ncbi:hypothetical protein KI387_013830, partial [Taxus chinensis]
SRVESNFVPECPLSEIPIVGIKENVKLLSKVKNNVVLAGVNAVKEKSEANIIVVPSGVNTDKENNPPLLIKKDST